MMWVTYYCIEVIINRHKMKYYGTHQSIRLTLSALVFEVSAWLIEILWAYLKLEKYSRLIERLNTSKLKTHFVSIGVHCLSLTWTYWIEILWAYLKLEKYSRLIERLNTSKLKTHFVNIGVHCLSLTWTCWIEILWAYLKLEKYSRLIERLNTRKLKTHTKFCRYPTQSLLLPKLA